MPQPSSPSEYDSANILATDPERDSGNKLSIDMDVTMAESSVDTDVTMAKSSTDADVTMAKSKVNAGIKSHIETYDKLMDALTDHELVLHTFQRALNQAEWPKHDHAEVQLMVVSNDVQTSMLSSSK